MQNSTFLRLSLRSVLNSPFFSVRRNVDLKNCFFTRFSSPVLFNPNSASVYGSSFKKSLSAAIRLDSASKTFDSKAFDKSTTLSSVDTITIKKCTFTKVGFTQLGEGAIIFNTENHQFGNLYIHESLFDSCCSKRTGAVFFHAQECTIDSTCFSNCYGAVHQAIEVETRPSVNAHLNLSTVMACYSKSDDAVKSTAFIHGGIAIVTNANFTLNEGNANTDGILSLATRGLINCVESNFDKNHNSHTIHCGSISPFKTFSLLNFFGNEGDSSSLIHYKYDISFSNCRFTQNKMQNFILSDVSETETSIIEFVECQFDFPYIENSLIIADQSQFNKVVTTNEINFLNKAPCLGHVIHNTNWSVVVGVILLCIIFVLIIASILLWRKDGNYFKDLCDCSKVNHKKVPDYEMGLADIQVETINQ